MASSEGQSSVSRCGNYAVRGSRGRRPSAFRRLVTSAMKFICLKCDEPRDQYSSAPPPPYSTFATSVEDDIESRSFDRCFESVSSRPRSPRRRSSTPCNTYFYNSPIINTSVNLSTTYTSTNYHRVRQFGLFNVYHGSDCGRTVNITHLTAPGFDYGARSKAFPTGSDWPFGGSFPF
jgi:hypothetical protein